MNTTDTTDSERLFALVLAGILLDYIQHTPQTDITPIRPASGQLQAEFRTP